MHSCLTLSSSHTSTSLHIWLWLPQTRLCTDIRIAAAPYCCCCASCKFLDNQGVAVALQCAKSSALRRALPSENMSVTAIDILRVLSGSASTPYLEVHPYTQNSNVRPY